MADSLASRQQCELRQLSRDGYSDSQAVRSVGEALDEVGLTAFDRNDEEERELAVRRTVEVSLRRLSADDRRRYEQMAIFPIAKLIPACALERLWTSESFYTRQLCRRFLEMSLLQAIEPETGRVLLHDVFCTYLRNVQKLVIGSFHRELVEAYRTDCPGDLSSGPSDGYYFENLTYHLAEGARTDELTGLLFSSSWLRAKLANTDIFGLVDDYQFLGSHADGEYLSDALRLSIHALFERLLQQAGERFPKSISR